MGRPSSYTEELGDLICEQIADGLSIRQICEAPEMPARSTIFKWLVDNKRFSDQYARAREAQAEGLADELIAIADDGTNDWMERRNKDGAVVGWMENGEALRRSALRVDTRKWIAARLLPKKYGDKVDLNHKGDRETPLAFTLTRIGYKD